MYSLRLKNGRLIDVESGSVMDGDLFVQNGRIVASIATEDLDEDIDVGGAYVSPGFIDGHLHIESSMLTPLHFTHAAVQYGTTSLFVDPHEIANVLGRAGVELFLEQADQVPLTMFVGIPSCVPATPLETSGGEITLNDIRELLSHPRVFGLAEMMNFPGIIHGIGDAREKVALALSAGAVVDGHCPGVTGSDLSTYISNGADDGVVRIGSDHECTTAEEALEKSNLGMYIMLRHGSASKDLENILPGLCRQNADLSRFGLVCDDLSAADLRKHGHINHLITIAAAIIERETGCTAETATVQAITMATLNHARYFRTGAGDLRPGAPADIAVFDSLDTIEPRVVLARGRIVVREGRPLTTPAHYDYSRFAHPVKCPPDLKDKLVVKAEGRTARVRVIEMTPDSLVTKEAHADLPVHEGVITADAEQGIHKVAVVERHRGTGNVAVGFVKGFDFRRGALAGTVAHDSHNLILVGADDDSMARAADAVRAAGGGLAVAPEKQDSQVLPLALAGLMSTQTVDETLAQHAKLDRAVQALGCKRDPFAAMSFLALPVIPALKLTDQGLVDVNAFDFVPLQLD